MSSALIALARAELERCAAALSAANIVHPEPASIHIECSIRGVTRRGRAYWRELRIQLNPDYFAVVGDKYRQTVAHEFAHLVQRTLEELRNVKRRERSHGPLWQSIMRRLGYSAERASDYGDCESVRRARVVPRPYLYRGACGCEFHLTARMHNAIVAGSRRRCGRHKQRIELVE